MPRNSSNKEQQRRVNYLVGFLGFVLLPGFITAIAPVSVTRFERHNGKVSAEVRVNVFFVIPYRHLHVADVRSVDDRFHQGELTTSHRFSTSDRQHETRAEDEAFLVIHDAQQAVEVPVSPANIRGALAKTHAFLLATNRDELRLVTVANWKFGVFIGGFLTLFTLLYVVGAVLSILRLVIGKRSPTEAASRPPRTIDDRVE